jgi:Animal haem peroxidase
MAVKRGGVFANAPTPTIVAALARHGGMYTLLDPDLMSARVSAFAQAMQLAPGDKECTTIIDKTLMAKLQAKATFFFYKLVADKPGYMVHAELINYLCEPGHANGVTYDTGADPSPTIPAAFTFVGQFIDHDLTFNGMELTADESGVSVQDEASPVIDLDNIYGPRLNVASFDYGAYKAFYDKIFNPQGKFNLNAVGSGCDVPRNTDVCKDDPNYGMAYIFDPRNDENQILLQIHILLERLHNKLIDNGFGIGANRKETIDNVRKEVVANWQSFVLNEYMPAIIRSDVLADVMTQIQQPDYGTLKVKPYRDLVTGKNVTRMPHEFAIGFRFGHSQLRPMYLLNNTAPGEQHYVLLFKDARVSDQVRVDLPGGGTAMVDGRDDLKGHRALTPDHVIDWNVFYPATLADINKSLEIDHKVTARVFNLPETAIPDDIKYITNLPHRNLLRGSQIGVVCGEDLARFYGVAALTPDQILTPEDRRHAVKELFKLDSVPDKHNTYKRKFKTPLWYYIIREAEVDAATDQDNGITSEQGKLGHLGSRLVAEVLAGACFYGNNFAFDPSWTSQITGTNVVKLRDVIDYVGTSPCS